MNMCNTTLKSTSTYLVGVSIVVRRNAVSVLIGFLTIIGVEPSLRYVGVSAGGCTGVRGGQARASETR